MDIPPLQQTQWDLVRENLECKEDLSGTQFAAEEMDPETSTLWFAGKQMLPEKHLKVIRFDCDARTPLPFNDL